MHIDYWTTLQRSIFESIPACIHAINLKGQWTFWNKFSEKYFNYRGQEIIHKKNINLIIPNKKIAGQILQTVEKYGLFQDEIMLVKKDGARHPNHLILTKIFNDCGNHIGYIGINYEITKQKKLERELEYSLKKYKNLFENANDILYCLDNNGKVTDLNKKGEELLGFRKKEWYGKKFADFLLPESLKTIRQKFKDGMKGKKEGPFNAKVHTKKGEIKILETRSSPLTKDGKIIGRFGISRDVTEKRNFEEEKLKLSRLAAIGTLAASIAHEIRNPLFSISTIAQSIEREFKNSQNKELILAMITEINRLKNFIDDMLLYSKSQKIVKRKIYPGKIFDEVLSANQGSIKNKNIKIKRFAEGKPCKKHTFADPLLIRRLILNLLTNAVEASNRGSSITIRTRSNSGNKGKNISISIHNRGKYIKKKNLEPIFDLFHTTKPKGCGLGLPICKKIVEAHNGTISVKSTKEHGTTFTVQF